MTWVSLTLQTTTPLINGGAGPADDNDRTAVRAPSIRGAMRYWFRALAGVFAGNDLELLARLEGAVFGRASTRPGEYEAASPFQIRIAEQPEISRERQPDFLHDKNRSHANSKKWIAYLLGPGLATWDPPSKGMKLTRSYVPAGQSFTVKLRFGDDPDVAALVLASLWMLCTYGGLGARVRRGFGGLRIIAADGLPPGPWNQNSILASESVLHSACLWPSREPLDACMKHLISLINKQGGECALATQQELPKYPVFSRTHTQAGLSARAFDTWAKTLEYAGEQLRYFRASEDHPEVGRRYHPQLKTPEWGKVFWGSEDHFPVAALGLPIVYDKKSSVNARNPAGELRRASPLWLRPVISEGEWRLFSFAFQGKFLPDDNGTKVFLKGGKQPRPVTILDEDVRELTDQWIRTLSKGDYFEPGDRVYRP